MAYEYSKKEKVLVNNGNIITVPKKFFDLGMTLRVLNQMNEYRDGKYTKIIEKVKKDYYNTLQIICFC